LAPQAADLPDATGRVSQGDGHEISLDAYRLSPERIAGQLEAAGFVGHATLVREAEPPEKTPQAYLVIRKPSA